MSEPGTKWTDRIIMRPGVASWGGLCLGIYLLLVSLAALVGIAIPHWVAASFGLAAGVLILIGR